MITRGWSEAFSAYVLLINKNIFEKIKCDVGMIDCDVAEKRYENKEGGCQVTKL